MAPARLPPPYRDTSGELGPWRLPGERREIALSARPGALLPWLGVSGACALAADALGAHVGWSVLLGAWAWAGAGLWLAGPARLELSPGRLRVTRGRLLRRAQWQVERESFEFAQALQVRGGACVLVVHRGGWRSLFPLASNDPAEAQAVCAAIERLMREGELPGSAPRPPDPWEGVQVQATDEALHLAWGRLRRTRLTLDDTALSTRQRFGPRVTIDIDDLADLRPGEGGQLLAVLRRGRQLALGAPLPRPEQARRVADLLGGRIGLGR